MRSLPAARWAVAVQPSTGALPSRPCLGNSFQAGLAVSTLATNAVSSTLRANVPISSSVSELGLAPARGIRRGDGL